MKNIFKRKFKVRVSHYYEDRYCIEYAYYRFIPMYNQLQFFVPSIITGSDDGWIIQLGTYSAMEKEAIQYKSYEDIKAHYIKQKLAYASCIEQRNKFYKQTQPYKNKLVHSD